MNLEPKPHLAPCLSRPPCCLPSPSTRSSSEYSSADPHRMPCPYPSPSAGRSPASTVAGFVVIDDEATLRQQPLHYRHLQSLYHQLVNIRIYLVIRMIQRSPANCTSFLSLRELGERRALVVGRRVQEIRRTGVARRIGIRWLRQSLDRQLQDTRHNRNGSCSNLHQHESYTMVSNSKEQSSTKLQNDNFTTSLYT